MANSKNLFGGLLKITGNNWNAYNTAKVEGNGKIIFANIEGDTTEEHNGKYIWANGVEYKVADSTNLDELIKRVADVSQYAIDSSNRLADLSTFVRETVNASVLDLSTRLGKAETSIGDVSARVNTLEIWRTHIDDVSVDKLDASVKNHETRIKALEDASAALASRIADVSQHAIDNDASITALKEKDQEIDGSLGRLNTSVNALEDANLLKNAEITAAAANNTATVTLTTTHFDDTTATDSFTVAGNDYVQVAGNADAITLAVKIGEVSTATEDTSGLATAKGVKDYVDDVLSDLEQALKFISDVTSTTAADLLTAADREAGDTFVASGDTFTYNGKTIEAGDLVIVKTDSAAGTASDIIVVERNLNGAVTAGAALATSSLVIGSNGTQAVETTNITVDALNTAIANANSAVQTVSATPGSEYLAATVSVNASTSTIDVSLAQAVVDTSAALSTVAATGSFADAKAVKDLVDAKAAEVKVEATLNSSTPLYVDATASVDATGRVISASVGVKTATLADASNGSIGLAMAKDVYDELTEVEEVMAAANAAMANTVGLNPDYSVTWSTASGIAADTSIVAAIEQVAQQAAQSGVTSFGEKKGAISIDTAVATDGSVNFAMDGSTLTGTVVGWSGLVDRVANVSLHANNNDASIADLSTNVIPVLVTRIAEVSTHANNNDASISDLSTFVRETVNASVADLSTRVKNLEEADYVRSVTGESEALTNPVDSYVNVAATTDAQGAVTIDASVEVATKTWDPSVVPATASGLATDAYVNNYVQEVLLWEVIGNE